MPRLAHLKKDLTKLNDFGDAFFHNLGKNIYHKHLFVKYNSRARTPTRLSKIS